MRRWLKVASSPSPLEGFWETYTSGCSIMKKKTQVFLSLVPRPTQLSVTCSTEKRGELGIFSHVSDVLQAMESWAGPGYETKYFLKCMHFSQNKISETISSVSAVMLITFFLKSIYNHCIRLYRMFPVISSSPIKVCGSLL